MNFPKVTVTNRIDCFSSFKISFKAKVGMLDNLLDIEVAYSLLKSGEEDLAKDPLDVNYEKLNTDLEVNK